MMPAVRRGRERTVRGAYRLLTVLGDAGIQIERHREGVYVYLWIRRETVADALGLASPPAERVDAHRSRTPGEAIRPEREDAGAAEMWRPVPGHELAGYEVSTLGRIRRIYVVRDPVATQRGADGYTLAANIPIAAAVLGAFRGGRPGGQTPLHRNGDQTDCRLANLEWGARAATKARRSTRMRASSEETLAAQLPHGVGPVGDGASEIDGNYRRRTGRQ